MLSCFVLSHNWYYSSLTLSLLMRSSLDYTSSSARFLGPPASLFSSDLQLVVITGFLFLDILIGESCYLIFFLFSVSIFSYFHVSLSSILRVYIQWFLRFSFVSIHLVFVQSMSTGLLSEYNHFVSLWLHFLLCFS